MNGTVSRRVFVGSVAAGVPLFAPSVSGALAQSSAGAVHSHPTETTKLDPVFEHIVRQIAGVHNRAKARGLTGEDARAISAQLRTMQVYGRQINIDGHTKQAARKFIDAKGADAALYVEIDRAAARRELKRYGVEADEQWFDSSKVDYLTRVQSRDDLLKTGLSGVLARMVTSFDALAEELDRRGSQVAKAVRVQTWNDGFCQQLQREMMRLEMDASFVCAFGALYGALASVCAMITAAIGVYLAAYLYYC